MTYYILPPITNEFTPIGEPITMWASVANGVLVQNGPATYTLTAEQRTFNLIDYSIEECASIIPCFGINNDIYNALVQRYSNPEHPLTFPTPNSNNKLIYSRSHKNLENSLYGGGLIAASIDSEDFETDRK